ncbi:MAG: hypothetical protein V7637_2027 [Mycobacteriales bacterium]|jgi:hypothetical protein
MPERVARRLAVSTGAARRSGAGGRSGDGDLWAFGVGPRDPRQVAALQRAAGNRAVSGLLSGSAVVQRSAWVGGQRVDPGDSRLSEPSRKLAGDELVHDYKDEAEFSAHAAGKTDYLGNLPGPTSRATWVRFQPNGCNVLGENHTEVRLQHVLPAVGSKSFIDEQFVSDALPTDSELARVYAKEKKDEFEKHGVGQETDKRKFGAESIFPKMGLALDMLLPYVNGDITTADLKGFQVGRLAPLMLKCAWAHAKDVAVEVAAKPATAPPHLAALAEVVEKDKTTLNEFITQQPTDSDLGDVLVTESGTAMLPPLARFCSAFIKAMLARIDTDAGLTQADRTGLAKVLSGERTGVFNTWRNMHIAHALERAVESHVRYVGMGAAHVKYLIKNKVLLEQWKRYDMRTGKSGNALAAFEQHTKKLAESAEDKAP